MERRRDKRDIIPHRRCEPARPCVARAGLKTRPTSSSGDPRYFVVRTGDARNAGSAGVDSPMCSMTTVPASVRSKTSRIAASARGLNSGAASTKSAIGITKVCGISS